MDKDCLQSHGISSTLSEKFYDNSDANDLVFCSLCGYRGDSNLMTVEEFQEAIYKCKICETNAKLVTANSTWTFNVFMHSVNALGIDIKVGFEPDLIFKPI